MHFNSPREALDLGIATVYQDLAVVPLMPVWRNFFLGTEVRKGIGPVSGMDIAFMKKTTKKELPTWASTCATSTSRSARCPAASGSAWRSPAPSTSARRC